MTNSQLPIFGHPETNHLHLSLGFFLTEFQNKNRSLSYIYLYIYIYTHTERQRSFNQAVKALVSSAVSLVVQATRRGQALSGRHPGVHSAEPVW